MKSTAETDARWLGRLYEVGAIESGHFALSSGLHSDEYVQCARVLERPALVEEAARELVERLAPRIDQPPQVIAAPAMGAIVLGHAVARAWGARSIWAERADDGGFTLRRGFSLDPGERVVLVEDVVTTSASVRALEALCRSVGAETVGVGVLVDRSGGEVSWSIPVVSLLQIAGDQYRPETCPQCESGVPIVKPGSRSRPPGTNPGS